MTLWGPLSEEDYVNDFEAVIELLDETAFRDGVGSDILVDYYKSARRVVREEESIDELDTDERENAIRFFEFGSYVRKLSEAPVIDFNGKNVDKDLGDLYKTDLEDKPLDFIHELRTACMYLDEDHEIALIDEEYSEGKVPEFRVLDTEPMIDVECKRPNPNKNNNAEKIPQKLAGVIAGVREKFNKRTQNLIHIEIPSIFQLSPSQNERLRHEVKGEIVERSPIINGVFLQQVGQKEKEGDPRSIVGVKGPDGDTTILDSSLDFIPHYHPF